MKDHGILEVALWNAIISRHVLQFPSFNYISPATG